MEQATIRQANASDMEALCDLYFEFHNFHAMHLGEYLRSLDGTSLVAREELKHKIREVLQGNDSVMLVAEVEGQVVGMAEIYLKSADPTNPAIIPVLGAYLQSLGVNGDFRHLGVGAKLVEAAEAWARQRGAAEMRLDSWEFSAGPLGFYEKLGYRTLRRTMVKDLSE